MVCSGAPHTMEQMTGSIIGRAAERASTSGRASKHYGAVRALDDVTLNVAPREFVSLLGPSGSGKTTLLGILGGFIQPSSGSIHFGGRDVTFMPPHKRDIGVVFQNYALFPHMSVGENVAFPLRARGLPKAGWPDKGARCARDGRPLPATSSAASRNSPAASASASRWRAR